MLNYGKIEPLRTSNTGVKLLDDIDSILDVNTYRDSCKVTWAHETSHGIASRIRMELNSRRGNGWKGADMTTAKHYPGQDEIIIEPRAATGQKNGFYVTQGEYIWVMEPQAIKLATVADSIPREYRKDIYDLYLRQQQTYWNNEPSYILDECFAYQNGTMVGIAAQLDQRAIESFAYCLEMCTYGCYLWKSSAQEDILAAMRFLIKRNEFLTARVTETDRIKMNLHDLRKVAAEFGVINVVETKVANGRHRRSGTNHAS